MKLSSQPIPPFNHLETRRNFLFGLAMWSADRLFEAQVDYFRLSIEHHQAPSTASKYAAVTAGTHAMAFAASLVEDIDNLGDVGWGLKGLQIADVLGVRLAAARREIMRAETEAGRTLPTCPVISAENAPWRRWEAAG